MRAVFAPKQFKPSTLIPPTREDNKARHVREMVVGAIEANRELTPAEAAEINKLYANDQVAAVISVTKRFAADVAVGATLEKFRPMLTRLLDGGAAGAIYDVANHRHSLQVEFEKTAWHKRKLELMKSRDEQTTEFNAAQADENTAPAKLRRLLGQHEQSIKNLNDHLNSRDPDLIAYRRAMEPTAAPTFNTLDWRMFNI